MKLSKKGAAIQRAIYDALASGKTLGGLLVGFAATVAGCGERHTPAHTMGRFPDSRYQENAKNENTEEFVTAGEIAEPGDVSAQEQGPSKTNAVSEVQGKGPVIRGEPRPIMGKVPAPPLPADQYRVKDGDTLTKIAKAHSTTVAELKRLNGFDGKRADNLVIGEVIKVPSHKPNVVNEGRRKTPSVKGNFPSKK